MTEGDRMSNTERRFTIRWRPWVGTGPIPGKYSVSIPNYDGGEVVVAEDYDAMAEQLRGAVDVLREVAEALVDAIVHNVNATEHDSAGWTQEDYDGWERARARAEGFLGSSMTGSDTE
jgi:hypothetical protein